MTSFYWNGETDAITADFTLIAVYEDPQRDPISGVRVRCSGVKQLRLPELGTSFFLAEVEIEDLSRHQLEGIRFKLKDFGESQFEVLCGGIELTIGDSSPDSGERL